MKPMQYFENLVSPFASWADNVLEKFPGTLTFKDFNTMTVPPVNIKEQDGFYHVEMSIPGHKKEDLKVELEEDILRISSEKQSSSEQKDGDICRKEFNYQSFSRAFSLPNNIDESSLVANYEDGLLKIKIQKNAEPDKKLKKNIEIK
jgi:HSP20 family protein